ncbi:MAG TPA: dTMP kinase [Burkholderiales bacterium]|nr:dTMP kinase [Burkholderiales bacterium]
MEGKFITLEGIDGAGKSTHIDWIAKKITGRGLGLVMTREPGGTALGEALRTLLLTHPMLAETEAMLMFAARREHLGQVIFPAITRGDWVLSDRFTDASFAYQGGGRGISVTRLEVLEDWVQQGFEPDLTLYFDLPVEAARSRLELARNPDRFEQEKCAFFERVRSAYLDRAHKHARIKIIDANRTIEEIQADISVILDSFLP